MRDVLECEMFLSEGRPEVSDETSWSMQANRGRLKLFQIFIHVLSAFPFGYRDGCVSCHFLLLLRLVGWSVRWLFLPNF